MAGAVPNAKPMWDDPTVSTSWPGLGIRRPINRPA